MQTFLTHLHSNGTQSTTSFVSAKDNDFTISEFIHSQPPISLSP